MKHTRTILLLLGLAVYLLLFYASELPSLEDKTGQIWSRFDLCFQLLLQLVFRPGELLEGWFGAPPEFALSDRAAVLLIAGVILACAAAVGWLLMALCGADRGLTRLENFVFSTAVGLNVVATYVLAVGLIGRLCNPWVFAVPAVLTLVLTVLLQWRRTLAASGENQEQEPAGDEVHNDDWLSPRWLWLAAPFVLIIVLGGMLPPVDFDVRQYHLQVPKEFFQQGRITFLPHNVYGNMALGTEMLSLLTMVVAGDWWTGALAGKTVIAATTLLTALGLFAAGRRFLSTTAGVVAALTYISIPWIVRVSTAGLVEGAVAYYLLLAVYAVLLWHELDDEKSDDVPATANSPARKGGVVCADKPRPPGRGYPLLLLAGYLAGGAVSCKYPAALFVVLPLAVWVFVRANHACKPVGIFLLAVLVGCGLWFGKNWVLTGNPTYPLLWEVFDGKTWTAEKNQQWNRVHRPHDFSLPALGKDLGRVGLRSEWLSPLLVPLVVLSLLAPRSRRLVIVLLAYFAYVIAAWWLLTHRIDRFWIPALPLVALLAGAGACWTPERWWRGLLIAMLLAGLGLNLMVADFIGYHAYFVGLDRLRDDPDRVDPWHRYLNTHLRHGDRVLCVGDAQVFDLEVPVLYSTCFDDCLFEQLAAGRTAEQVRAELAGRGISTIYVHWGEIARYRATYGFTDFVQPAVFDSLVEQGVLEPLPEIGGHPGRGYRALALVATALRVY